MEPQLLHHDLGHDLCTRSAGIATRRSLVRGTITGWVSSSAIRFLRRMRKM
jgi:hypothetical protein